MRGRGPTVVRSATTTARRAAPHCDGRREERVGEAGAGPGAAGGGGRSLGARARATTPRSSPAARARARSRGAGRVARVAAPRCRPRAAPARPARGPESRAARPGRARGRPRRSPAASRPERRCAIPTWPAPAAGRRAEARGDRAPPRRRAGRRRRSRRGRVYRMPGRDRHAAVAAEGARGDLDADRSLAALVLGAVDHAHDLAHQRPPASPADDLLRGSSARARRRPRGSGRAARRAAGSRCRAGRAAARPTGGRSMVRPGMTSRPSDRVAPAREAVDPGLGHVAKRGEAADHVPVEGGVADRDLALVAGGQHQAPELVRQRHQERTAHPGLEVLLGDVAREAGERLREHVLEGRRRGRDRQRPEGGCERLGQRRRPAEALGRERTEGIATPVTRSGPRASAARVAVRAESMPPERPMTTPGKPFLPT